MFEGARDPSRVLETFAVFLRLGCTSFGGPVAHLGYFRDEFVVRRRWLTDAEYAQLVALCQFLPGPASSQVGFALGLRRAGLPGAIGAWFGFTIPSALLMLMLALGASTVSGPIADGVLLGVLAVAVAVVAQAVSGMARSLAPDVQRASIAIVAAIVALLIGGVWGQLAVLCGGAIAGVALLGRTAEPEAPAHEHDEELPIGRRGALAALSAAGALLALLPIIAASLQHSAFSVADAAYRAGATVFGGGHVVLATLEAEPAFAGPIGQDHLLFGYGAAQALPGPLFSFAAYAGALVDASGSIPARAGLAAVALVAIFLPGLLLLIGVLPFWGRLNRRPTIAAAMQGANAAVVGVLAAAFVDPVLVHGVTGPATLAVAILALVALMMRVPPWLVVVAGAACGAGLSVL
ncbi:chromate efflux transporter [Leucobacter sp. NPDC077196]|uniref:chromate efflux transporter n=1 Tax=Leucobacter sp. NPDC077196 TaxID=3154959 RepID=UPI003415403C